MIIWREGVFTDASGAISADDRGWLVGDAVFETLLVENGIAAFLERHLERMRVGAATFGIERRLDSGEIASAIAGAAAKNCIEGRAACRLTLSRAGGARGLAPSPSARAQLVVSLSTIAPAKSHMRLTISSHRRWTGASTNAFKCAGAYAENILARKEAGAAGADEGVMLNEAGRVACAAAANIFIVADRLVMTPSIEEGAMPGVVRRIIIEEARRIGYNVQEREIEPCLMGEGALFLTNSIVGAVRSGFETPPAGSDVSAVENLIEAYQRRLGAEFLADRPTERA